MTKELYLVIDRDGMLRARSAGAMTRDETVRDILGGEFTSVAFVYCICPSEGSCRNVTEDVARLVRDAASDPLTGSALDFVEEELGIRAAREVG